MSVSSTDLMQSLDDLTYSKVDEKGITKQRGSSELGKEEFLKLLTTQMSYQDPLNPQDDSAFISQLAQFSSLEQMQNLNSTFSNTSAYTLIGRYVEIENTSDTGQKTTTRGIVDSVSVNSNGAKVLVDGRSYSVDDIVLVADGNSDTAREVAMGNTSDDINENKDSEDM